jgi:hypothetical protein
MVVVEVVVEVVAVVVAVAVMKRERGMECMRGGWMERRERARVRVRELHSLGRGSQSETRTRLESTPTRATRSTNKQSPPDPRLDIPSLFH